MIFWHHFYSSWDIAITPLVTKLRPFFLQKFHKVVNFQKAPWTLFHCGLVIWCKFQLIGTTIEGAVTFGVKYLKMLILFFFFKEIRYQNCFSPFFAPTANLLIPIKSDQLRIESQWALFETRRDRSITYVKMKEKEEIRFPPYPLKSI